MSQTTDVVPVHILLVEDDPGDIVLTKEALKNGRIYNALDVVEDGERALKFLRREAPYSDATRPDLILLDLNMPRMDGRETLEHIKADPALRAIPVVVLTTSDDDQDIEQSYDLQAASRGG